MSLTFKPIKLDKTSLREAAAFIFRALLHCPVALTLGMLFMACVIPFTADLGHPSSGTTAFTQGVVCTIAAFCLVQAPAMLAVYMLFKTAHRDSFSGFIAKIIGTRYPVRLAGTMVLYIVGFTLLSLLVPPASTGESTGASVPLWLALLVSTLFVTATLWVTTGFMAEEVIHMRTGFSSKQVERYWALTKRRNKRVHRTSILCNGLLQMASIIIFSSGTISLLMFLFCQILSAMLWAYVMFSSTFPPKEKVKQTALVTATDPS